MCRAVLVQLPALAATGTGAAGATAAPAGAGPGASASAEQCWELARKCAEGFWRQLSFVYSDLRAGAGAHDGADGSSGGGAGSAGAGAGGLLAELLALMDCEHWRRQL